MGKKFEYRLLDCLGISNIEVQEIFLKELNKLGEEGWEACGIFDPTIAREVLLKREKE